MDERPINILGNIGKIGESIVSKSTELFSIVCKSCLARLKVTQESAIGQILACPKCSNMVKVEPPEDWEVSGYESENSASAKAQSSASESFDEIDALLSGQVVPAKKKPVPVQQPVRVQQRRPAPANNHAAKSATASSPVLPNDQWTSNVTRQKQKWLLLIFGLLAVMVTGAILAFAMITRLLDDGTDVAAGNDSESANASVVDGATDSGESETDNSTEEIDEPANNDSSTASSDNESTENNNTVQSTEIDDGSSSSDSDAENPAVADTGTADSNTADSGTEDSQNGNAEETQLPIVSKENNKTTTSIDDINSNNGFVEAKPEDRPKSILEELEVISDLSSGADSSSILDQMHADQREEMIGMSRLYIEKPSEIEIDFERQTKMLVHGLRTETTIRGLADKLFRLTQIPITIDADVVAAAILEPAKARSVEGIEKTIAEIGQTAFNDFGLAFVIDENGAQVVSSKFDKPVQIEYEIPSAETFTEDQFEGLVQSIKNSIDPDVWKNEENEENEAALDVVDNQLVCRALPGTQIHIAALMNKLKAAYLLKQDPANQDAKKDASSRFEIRSKLDSVKLESGRVLPVRLETVANEIEKEFGLTILFDWRNLEREGWNPNVMVPWNPEGRSLTEMLNDICHAMKLDWRIVNDGVIFVTTHDEFDRHMDIEVYPRSAYKNIKLNEKQLMATLESQLGAAVSRNPTAVVSFQPKYDCIIAVLPQDIQFQLAASLKRLNGE